jgi:Fe2+ transport system protein FeoA
MTCSFCSLVFDERGARLQCAGCGLAGGCRSVRCPRCAYEMPEELGILTWLRAWRDNLRARVSKRLELTVLRPSAEATTDDDQASAIPLLRMRPDEPAVVVDVCGGSDGDTHKCLALGILPGSMITLRKRSPSFIFEIGFSRFAVDERIAMAVRVRPVTRSVLLRVLPHAV